MTSSVAIISLNLPTETAGVLRSGRFADVGVALKLLLLGKMIRLFTFLRPILTLSAMFQSPIATSWRVALNLTCFGKITVSAGEAVFRESASSVMAMVRSLFLEESSPSQRHQCALLLNSSSKITIPMIARTNASKSKSLAPTKSQSLQV